MNVDAINTILLIRTNIIPPYTYDDDECERDISDYIEYYKENIDMSIPATINYIDAILRFRSNSNEENIKQIFEARKLFVKFFPFAYDELESESEGFGVEYMRKIFENDKEVEVLVQDLKEYLNALLKIKHDR